MFEQAFKNIDDVLGKEAGRLCRLVAVRKDLAVHGLGGDTDPFPA